MILRCLNLKKAKLMTFGETRAKGHRTTTPTRCGGSPTQFNVMTFGANRRLGRSPVEEDGLLGGYLRGIPHPA